MSKRCYENCAGDCPRHSKAMPTLSEVADVLDTDEYRSNITSQHKDRRPPDDLLNQCTLALERFLMDTPQGLVGTPTTVPPACLKDQDFLLLDRELQTLRAMEAMGQPQQLDNNGWDQSDLAECLHLLFDDKEWLKG